MADRTVNPPRTGARQAKRLFVFAVLAAVSAGIGSPASAAPDNLQRYAACLTQTRAGQVRQLLHAPSAAAGGLAYHALADDNRCFTRVFGNEFLPEDVAFSQDLLRGRLAEQALLARSGELAGLQPLPLQQKRYLRPWFVATGRNAAVDEMGACMADTDPAGIAALIKTDAGSSDESAAIGPLSQSLTKCLSAGTRLNASRQALRAALADALYQRLINPALSLIGLKGTAQ